MKNAEQNMPEVIRLNGEMLDQINGGCVQLIATVFDFAVGAAVTCPFGIICKKLYNKVQSMKKNPQNKIV